MACMRKNARVLIACREKSEHFRSARLYSDDIRSHRLAGAQLWVFLWQALTRDAMSKIRFVVNAAGWLQSMVLRDLVEQAWLCQWG